MASCIGKLLGERRGQGVLYSRRCLGCGLRWPREMPLGWPVILVCMEGASVSGCSCLLSCSLSTRTYLLPSVSPYTLYRMIFSSLLYMNNFFQGRLLYRITYYCTRAWEKCSLNAPGVANCRGRVHGNRPGIARCSGRPLGDCT